MLTIESLSIQFGGIKAVTDVTFQVNEGEIFGLIGPNGAGKTTLFNAVSRLNNPTQGSISFRSRQLLEMQRHEVVRAGIARTFQNIVLYPALTVLENVLLGAHNRAPRGFMRWGLGSRAHRVEERKLMVEGRALLDLLELSMLADRPAEGLPLGTLKRIELARALMARPALLMLDEPANGLTSAEVGELGSLFRRLKSEHALTLLLVEHHMGLVMSLCERIAVLDFGELIALGAPDEIKQNSRVVKAYLGGENAAA